MFQTKLLLSALVSLGVAVSLGGCGSEQKPAPPAKPNATGQGKPTENGQHKDHKNHQDGEHQDHQNGDQGAHHEHGDHHHAGDVDEAEISEALAKLSAADKAAAEKQRVCPVSDERLGSMGVPLKVNVKGQELFLCCESCEEKIQADPDKYLAKLEK